MLDLPKVCKKDNCERTAPRPCPSWFRFGMAYVVSPFGPEIPEILTDTIALVKTEPSESKSLATHFVRSPGSPFQLANCWIRLTAYANMPSQTQRALKVI